MCNLFGSYNGEEARSSTRLSGATSNNRHGKNQLSGKLRDVCGAFEDGKKIRLSGYVKNI